MFNYVGVMGKIFFVFQWFVEVFVQFDECMGDVYVNCFGLAFVVIVIYVDFQIVDVFYFYCLKRVCKVILDVMLREVFFVVFIVDNDFVFIFFEVNVGYRCFFFFNGIDYFYIY